MAQKCSRHSSIDLRKVRKFDLYLFGICSCFFLKYLETRKGKAEGPIRDCFQSKSLLRLYITTIMDRLISVPGAGVQSAFSTMLWRSFYHMRVYWHTQGSGEKKATFCFYHTNSRVVWIFKCSGGCSIHGKPRARQGWKDVSKPKWIESALLVLFLASSFNIYILIIGHLWFSLLLMDKLRSCEISWDRRVQGPRWSLHDSTTRKGGKVGHHKIDHTYCWWFQNPTKHVGCIKSLLTEVSYQPQLVISSINSTWPIESSISSISRRLPLRRIWMQVTY